MTSNDPRESGHESTDLRGGVPQGTAALMVPLAVLIYACVYGIFSHLIRTRDIGPPAPAGEAMRTPTPGSALLARPALLATPLHPIYGPAEVKRLRQQEDAVLTTYAYVDRKRGMVRIPIEQAIQLLVERGGRLSVQEPASAAPTQGPPKSEEVRP
jgi:hypothetical protein